MEKNKISREIFADEMTLAQRRELEEEVLKEMASERALGMPMQKQVGNSILEWVSMSFNPRTSWDCQSSNFNKFGGPRSQSLSYTNV